MTSAARVVATFVPPGAKSNPIALGSDAGIDQGGDAGWHLKIVSVIPDGTSQVLAADPRNQPPPPGLQDFLLLVSATPRGIGALDLVPLIVHLYLTVPGGRPIYGVAGLGCGVKLPPPDILRQGVSDGYGAFDVSAGQTATGYLCFQVASVSARHLVLFTEPPLVDPYPSSDYPPQPDADAVWFALR